MKIGKILLVAAGLLAVGVSPALAREPGTWTMYGGAGSINPDGKVISFTVPDEEFGDITAGLEIDRAASMTFGGTYMIDENWAVDILAAMPFTHDVRAIVDIPGESGSAKIGEVKQLPPTLSLQYHFTTEGPFDPYVALGVNYTHFYDEKLVSEMIDEGFTDMRFDSSWGFAAQAGGEWALNENWLFSVDVRYIDIATDVELHGDAFIDGDGSLNLGEISVDPWMYSANIGYQFR